MKRSKNYLAAAEKVKKDHLYTPLEAVTLAKETSTVKYNASVEVALVLGEISWVRSVASVRF